MNWPPNPFTLLAGSSIILSVCIWPIICYNFVLNCMSLMVLRLTYAKNNGIEEYEVIDDYKISTEALNVTMHAGLIVMEGVLVLGLVVQFMSSFDYLTGNGQDYAENFWRCHKKVLLLTAIILTLKLFISFFFLNTSDTVVESLLELYAIALNFIFLLIALNITGMLVEQNRSSEEGQTNNSNEESQQVNAQSFLDAPPAYCDLQFEKEKVTA